MKTITMYELLGLVKDGKAPKKIKYINSIWEYNKEIKDYLNDNLWLIRSMNSIALIEREVEILEEEKKIPEKLSTWYCLGKQSDEDNIKYANYNFDAMYVKINEICDYLKSKGE